MNASRPRRILATLLCLLCLGLFFRGQIGDGFTLLLGDRHDGVIALAVMEHWANWLGGRAIAWDRTFYFHPVPATLGYNDGYLGFGLPYAAFRAGGADPFLAGELTNATLRAIGFAGMALLARRVFALSFGWSVLAACLFTLSNNLFIRASHVQLFSVSLVPVLGVLAHGAATALLAGWRGALLGWGAAAVLWFALMLLTGFYMAWYATFFGAALLLAWLAVAGRAGRQRLRVGVVRCWAPLLALLPLAVLANLPFLGLYLPKARETGMHDYAGMVAQYTVAPLDLLHVGERNWLWGWLVRALNDALRPGFPAWSEQMTGLPPLLLLLFLGALVWLCRAAPTPRVALLRAVALATLITWALTLRIGDVSAWWLVYQVVPGAKAARVVARYQIFVVIPVILLALSLLAAVPMAGWRRFALGAVAAVLLLEQMNGYAPRFLDRPLEASRLRAVPAPPPGCRSFFVDAARTESRFGEETANAYNHNTEAMLVAETLRLPTINGISTFNPPHWPAGYPPLEAYLEAVRRYAEAWQVKAGLCSLDLDRFGWKVTPFSDQ
jgi:hypothetical protein